MHRRILAILYYVFGYLTCIAFFLSNILYLQFAALTYCCYLSFQLIEAFKPYDYEDN